MPNHLHVLIHLSHNKDSINKILANGKRFLAYEIVRRLEDAGKMIYCGASKGIDPSGKKT